jgi:hypothetical protein
MPWLSLKKWLKAIEREYVQGYGILHSLRRYIKLNVWTGRHGSSSPRLLEAAPDRWTQQGQPRGLDYHWVCGRFSNKSNVGLGFILGSLEQAEILFYFTWCCLYCSRNGFHDCRGICMHIYYSLGVEGIYPQSVIYQVHCNTNPSDTLCVVVCFESKLTRRSISYYLVCIDLR